MAAAGARQLLAWSCVAPLSQPQGTRCLGVTHTRQDCDVKDYRKIRIVRHQKEVSENFAIDSRANLSEVESDSVRRRWGALGHMKVCKLNKATKTGRQLDCARLSDSRLVRPVVVLRTVLEKFGW
ncbi:NADH dehydrogenase [ubiquinone] iron-sulfur protein 6, mitochondrial-like [Balaenoptera ricei]|uniref:NADH dehydrogenase [ubiquinone] iron-sulfur protein 6, mitochondrial-like n=1 Tax=Balaenoptera ricei TaxID=2746895 RepID=UPI0028BEEFFD|nr:NADH dehydrogenase [ubiquinone] iron-sulfur protein 6, mitochondrial-like [Balaenoptera ricei]